MRSEYTRNQETCFGGSSLYQVHDASKRNEDVPRLERNIMVTGNEERDSRIHGTMPTMSTSQSRAPKASGTTTIATDTGMEVGAHYYGFCYRIIELATGI